MFLNKCKDLTSRYDVMNFFIELLRDANPNQASTDQHLYSQATKHLAAEYLYVGCLQKVVVI
jgi:hypothetical protein